MTETFNDDIPKVKIRPRDKPHYVNNAEFSLAVVEYTRTLNAAEAAEESLPIVTNYIAECFMKISEGLSHRPNFINYSFREEMVMDAVENCLKAIRNYKLDHYTRTGKPNAFSYFTQITWFAFLRRIDKEQKQSDIKIKFMMTGSVSDFTNGIMDTTSTGVVQNYVDQLKSRINVVKVNDSHLREFSKKEKQRLKEQKAQASKMEYLADSDLAKAFE